jgi:hypothetical protein
MPSITSDGLHGVNRLCAAAVDVDDCCRMSIAANCHTGTVWLSAAVYCTFVAVSYALVCYFLFVVSAVHKGVKTDKPLRVEVVMSIVQSWCR